MNLPAGLPQLWRSLIDFEAKASRIQNYEALVVPGLPQAAEYARALIQDIAPIASEAELTTWSRPGWPVRRCSHGPCPTVLRYWLTRGALRRPVGELGVMHRQLQHLLDAAEQPHVTLRLVPFAAGAHAGLRGSFMALEGVEELVMPTLDLSGARWRKSSRSTDVANCVEVASTVGAVAVRNSKNPPAACWPSPTGRR